MHRAHAILRPAYALPLSVIVHDFHISQPGIRPYDAEPPLVVDRHTPLPSAVATQGLEPIPRPMKLSTSCAARRSWQR